MNRAVCFPLCYPLAQVGPADPNESVVAGREALDRWWSTYPWYDAQTDGVARIDVSPPWYLKWDWFWDAFDFSWSGSIGSMSWLEWAAWITVILLLIVLVYLLVRAFLMRQPDPLGSAARAGESDADAERRRVEALPLGKRRSRSNFLAEARRCYQEGDYREAIIYLFSHQLVYLDKNQLIRLAKGKTNRQYLRELGRRTAVRRRLEETMLVFEDVFFGNYSIDRARFETCWFRLGDFESLVVEGTA